MKAADAVHYDRRQQIDGETAITEKHHFVRLGSLPGRVGEDEVGRAKDGRWIDDFKILNPTKTQEEAYVRYVRTNRAYVFRRTMCRDDTIMTPAPSVICPLCLKDHDACNLPVVDLGTFAWKNIL